MDLSIGGTRRTRRQPFSDDRVERVFHVCGVGGFDDPPAAGVEMGRVARQDRPLVVMDGRLDPDRDNDLLDQAAFGSITLHDDDPYRPTGERPPSAVAVIEEQLSRSHDCLTWRTAQ